MTLPINLDNTCIDYKNIIYHENGGPKTIRHLKLIGHHRNRPEYRISINVIRHILIKKIFNFRKRFASQLNRDIHLSS